MGNKTSMKLLTTLRRPAAAAAFTPTDIAGLISWYDANDISTLWQDSARTTAVTSDADPVGAWDDKSATARHATVATTPNKPTYKTAIQNGLPVLRLDAGDWLLNATGAQSQPLTYFAVCKGDALTDFLLDGTGGSNTGSFVTFSSDQLRLYAGAALYGTAFTLGSWHMVSSVLNGASSSISIDGAAAATGNAGGSAPTGITIGAASGGGSLHWLGDIAEVIIYDTALSAGDIATVNTYLNDKWAVY